MTGRPNSDQSQLEVQKHLEEQRHRAILRTNADYHSVNQHYQAISNTQQEIAIKFASIAINSLVFSSGGSIVALIAYVSNLTPGYILPRNIFFGFLCFFYSVFFAIFCAASAYVTQIYLQTICDLNRDLSLKRVLYFADNTADDYKKELHDAIKLLEPRIKSADSLWKSHQYFSLFLWILSAVLFLGGGYFCLVSFNMI